MKLVPTLAWTIAGDPPTPVDARLLPLLAALGEHGSLAGAAAAIGVPYRTAWGLLGTWQGRLGAPLARLERGRGTRLAPLGERLLASHTAAAGRLERTLTAAAIELAPQAAVRRSRLRIAASHDLALARVRDTVAPDAGLEIDLEFVGSLESLARYVRGEADLAGCHLAAGPGGAEARAALLGQIRPSRDALIGFIEREQGFIVARGNPHRLRGFADIARRRLRFVNRQRGSATRVLIDLLLRESRVEPAQIAGYRNEEITHSAIAATVASGGADVAFGLRAAAAQLELGFVPVLHEHYVLVCRRDRAPDPAIARLRALLAGAETAAIVRPLAGYRLWHAGEIVPAALLSERGRRSRTGQTSIRRRVAAK